MARIVAWPRPTFRPLTADDLSMLHEWLHRTHVRKWWHEPSTIEELAADYLAPESTTRAYIAMLEGRPIGFVQSYVVMGSGGGWWECESDPGARGIDQFLADEANLGRGLGSAMVRAFVAQLFADPSVSVIQTDPSPDNERAIRCYRRAGFVAVGEVSTPDGPRAADAPCTGDLGGRRRGGMKGGGATGVALRRTELRCNDLTSLLNLPPLSSSHFPWRYRSPRRAQACESPRRRTPIATRSSTPQRTSSRRAGSRARAWMRSPRAPARPAR
jgi:RimJ/RimL family protein N-acetyltransferase